MFFPILFDEGADLGKDCVFTFTFVEVAIPLREWPFVCHFLDPPYIFFNTNKLIKTIKVAKIPRAYMPAPNGILPLIHLLLLMGQIV